MIFKYDDNVKFFTDDGKVHYGKVISVDHEKETLNIVAEAGKYWTVNSVDAILDYNKEYKRNLANIPDAKETKDVVETNTEQYNDSHYASLACQPMDAVSEWPTEQQIGFYRGNILKYTMRLGNKDAGIKEASKILRYAQWLYKAMQGEKINPREQ